MTKFNKDGTSTSFVDEIDLALALYKAHNSDYKWHRKANFKNAGNLYISVYENMASFVLQHFKERSVPNENICDDEINKLAKIFLSISDKTWGLNGNLENYNSIVYKCYYNQAQYVLEYFELKQ